MRSRHQNVTFFHRFVPFASCLAALVVLGGCGGGSGPTASGGGGQNSAPGLIGVAGGSLTSADGNVTLVVPPNAVSVDTQFTISPANGFPSSSRIVGTVYDIEPTGTVFPAGALPLLTMTLPAGVDPATVTVGTLENGQWVSVPGSSGHQGAQIVTASLTHLSPYAALEGVADPPPANQNPIASAGGPYLGQVNQPVTFTAVGSVDPDNDSLTYTWNFGDSSALANGSTLTTTHTYASPGTFSVTLTVSDGRGGSDTVQTTAEITNLPPANTPPIADAGGPYAGTVGQSIPFSAAASRDLDGDSLTFVWDFGDGGAASVMNPLHAYTSDRIWPVKLTVSDSSGASDEASTTATISPAPSTNTPPVINSTSIPTTTGLTNQILQFDAAATDGDGHALTYSWNFGDQTISPPATSASAAHAYSAAGTFTVTLTVDDGHGGQATAPAGTVTITAATGGPVAFSQAYTLYLRQSSDFAYTYSYAMTLAGSGTPPLTFSIVSFPALRDPLAAMDLLLNNYYQWWDSVAGGWRPECRAYPLTDQTCRAGSASQIDLTNANRVIVSPAGAPATVVYVPLRCGALPVNRSDEFTFTVTDGNGVTSAPATVSIAFHPAICKGGTH